MRLRMPLPVDEVLSDLASPSLVASPALRDDVLHSVDILAVERRVAARGKPV